MSTFTIVNDVRLILTVEAPDANWAVRIARDTSRDDYEIGDDDEIVVYSDGEQVEFDWDEVEALYGKPEPSDEDSVNKTDDEWYDDGKTLIAGVLYDKETGEEAEPIEDLDEDERA